MGRRKGEKNKDPELSIKDYRHKGAKRKNIPPAGLAAQGEIREKPKIQYFYNPHLPPVLRFDQTGGPDKLPELLEVARKCPLTACGSHSFPPAGNHLRRRRPILGCVLMMDQDGRCL